MPLELLTLPCLRDNYAYIVHDEETGATAAIDVPESGPLIALLAARQWTLSDILLTHHHQDHIDGAPKLKAATGARLIGAAADAHRLPPLDLAVAPGDPLEICGEPVEVLDVSGHTVGHLAFHFPQSGFLFSGDSLMAMGCGRLFEGTPEMMWNSLSRLMTLPGETLVCSGHEYTESNLRFAEALEPGHAALILRGEGIRTTRAEGRPTVPSRLSEELATNPFLRASDPTFKAAIGMAGATDAEVFTEIRLRKDNF